MAIPSKEIAVARDMIRRCFSRISTTDFEVTSPRTTQYNCIAWAAGCDDRWWWPGGLYWPNGVERESTVAAFIKAFGSKGYTPCESPDFDPYFEKVALYVGIDGLVTHAALQKGDGTWTSKLGQQWDITHELEALCGFGLYEYGQVGQILRRLRD